MNIFDPTMPVPPDVAAAADKLTNYFADLGFSEWRLNGCASREQLEFTANLLERTASENEALAQRLAVRMEELQQAVQARLAAEKERDQLAQQLANLERFTGVYIPNGQERSREDFPELFKALDAQLKGGAV